MTIFHKHDRYISNYFILFKLFLTINNFYILPFFFNYQIPLIYFIQVARLTCRLRSESLSLSNFLSLNSNLTHSLYYYNDIGILKNYCEAETQSTMDHGAYPYLSTLISF